MNGENDLIYHEPLPRVLLIDFKPGDVEVSKKSGINFKIACPPSPRHVLGDSELPSEVSRLMLRNEPMSETVTTFATQQKFSEIDIVFLYAQYPKGQKRFRDNFFADGSSVSCSLFSAFLISERNGFFVCFVGENSAQSLQRFFPNVGVYDARFRIGQTPHRFAEEFADDPFFGFVKANFKCARGYQALSGLQGALPDLCFQERPFLADDLGNEYAMTVYQLRSGTAPEPAIVLLPVYSDTPAKVIYILEKILPKMKPDLFPNVVDFGYLSTDEFLSPELIKLRKERDKLEKGYQEKIAEYQDKEEKVRKERQYLTDLLAQKGEVLKKSCNRVLEEILKMVASSLKVSDVDIEDDIRAEDRRLKDDLRIELPSNRIILIDGKGTEKTFGQGPLNQLSEHRRIFLKHHKTDYDIEHVHSLGILNHQLSINPKNRDDIFGSYTQDALERIKSDQLAIIGTFELFKLHKALSEKRLSADEQDILKFLTNTGINTFQQFSTSDQK